MKRAKKKSDLPYIKPPDGVQINKISIPATASVAAVGKQTAVIEEAKKIQGITVTRDLDKLKTISISAFNLDKLNITKKDNKTDESDLSTMPKDAFELEKLLSIWIQFAANLQTAGKESLYVTFTKRHPQILDENNIGFVIDNKVQEQDIEKLKPELLEFIRTALNNFHVQLHLALTTDENAKELLYTSRDKFKKLAEKNPKLIELKKRFNLDLEF